MDPHNEIDAVKRLPQWSCLQVGDSVPEVGKGQEGKDGGTSPAALTAGTRRAFRPEHNIKAHSVFGTNWLTWQPGEVVHSLIDLRGRYKQSLRKLLARPSDFGSAQPCHPPHLACI